MSCSANRRPLTTYPSLLYAYLYDSCYSCIGRTMDPKGQVVSIGFGCEHEGIILHELMHTVGFFHTNSRPDRDAYVIVYTKNIRSGECISETSCLRHLA